MSLYLNGRCHRRTLEAAEARRFGFHLGLSVFTTVGVRAGHPMFLELHLDRLERDARLLNLCIPSRADLSAPVSPRIRKAGKNAGVA